MKAVALALPLALALFASTQAPAGPLPAESEPAQACMLPSDGEENPMMDRSGTLARYEQLSPDCLKDVVLECARVANRVLLDQGSAAVCSFGYEALLRRGFGGDFHALVAWWQTARGTVVQ